MKFKFICMLSLVALFIISGCSQSPNIVDEIDDNTKEEVQQEVLISNNDEARIIELGFREFDLDSQWDYNDVIVINLEDLAYLRNSVYAKHGYVFVNKKYTDYFSKYTWYKEKDNFKESDLSIIDLRNIKLAQSGENDSNMTYKGSNDAGINHPNLKIEIIDFEYNTSTNNPKRVIISDGKNEVNYDSPWNDGLHASIVDFDFTDEFIDVFIVDSGTDISSLITIYRYDGNSIVKHGSFEQFGGDFIYDELALIYYWHSESENSDYNYYYDYRLNRSFLIEDELRIRRINKGRETQN